MPTGYTACIEKGIEFNDFALQCARGMGALIMMRDEPMGAEIPEFKPTDYYAKRVEEAKADFKRFVEMSEADAQEAANAEAEAQIAADVKRADEAVELENKYREMLKKVRAWNPPTPDHVGLKDFMASQIEESIRFDCGSSYKSFHGYKTGTVWKSEKVAEAIKTIGRAEQDNLKEIERTDSRNAWVKALRESLTTIPESELA